MLIEIHREPVAMAPHPPAATIVGLLRRMDWCTRHVRFGWLRDSPNKRLAALVQELMSPDELLYGTATGLMASDTSIPLLDRHARIINGRVRCYNAATSRNVRRRV